MSRHFGEPDVAIRADRDCPRVAYGGGRPKFSDHPGGRDAPDEAIGLDTPVEGSRGEPDIAIRRRRQLVCLGAITLEGGDEELRDLVRRGDAPDAEDPVVDIVRRDSWLLRGSLNKGASEQIEHGLVVHHFRWCDQRHQDDARFAAIDHIVGVIAHIRSLLGQNQCRVRVGGTYPQISQALIPLTTDASVLRSHLFNPVMPLGIELGEFL